MRIIGKKSIRKCSKYLEHLTESDTAYVGLPLTEDITGRLREIGFENLIAGESLIPSPKLGRISKFNAVGKEVPQRDLPKETFFQHQYREWKDWHGNTHSGFSYVQRKRYPRKQIAPPSVELTIIQSEDKKFVIAGQAFTKGQASEEDITHRINLILEIFKIAEIIKGNLAQYQIPQIRRLSWDVLPTGNMPWEQFQRHLTPLLERTSKNKKMVIAERLETVSKYQPDFHAVGTNGYRGYVIFGFSELNLYIFETAEYGNATYVFEGEWETLSQMTKAEIISENLYKERFVHLRGWESKIASLFPNNDDNQMIS